MYWCTADIGWITGHSYVTYGPPGFVLNGGNIYLTSPGPLLNTATSVLFEGTPFHPDYRRCWQIIAEHRSAGQCNIFRTAGLGRSLG